MKKRSLVMLVAAGTLSLALLPGPVSAFFSDRRSAEGMEGTAGYIEIATNTGLPDYGIPGDVLKNGYLTVHNRGPTGVRYELELTADEYTAVVLDRKGAFDALALYDGEEWLDTKTTLQPNGSLTLTYSGTLPSQGSQTFEIALAIKGENLLDGNFFASWPINLTHKVTAYESGGTDT